MDDGKELTLEERREAFEKKRRARNEQYQREHDAQHLFDEEAIFDIEEQIGVSRVKKLKVPYEPGLPTMVAVRCPTPAEMKRFRMMAQETDRDGRPIPGANVKASEALAHVCRVYPDEELYEKVKQARPAVHALAGAHAVKLGMAEEADEVKG